MTRPPRTCSRRAAIGAISIPVCGAAGGCLQRFDPRSSCSDRTRVALQAVRHPAHVANEFSTARWSLPYGTESLVATAVENGAASVRDYYAPALRDRYVVTGPGKRFYRVRTSDSDPTAVTGYEYAVAIEGDGGSVPDDESPSQFDALPTADRETIRAALGTDDLLGAPHFTTFTTVFAYDDPSVRDASPFVPGTDGVSVAWDEQQLGFSFESERSVTLTTTTVTAEPVADSLESFFDYVVAEHGVVLEDLPSEHRSIVSAAIDDEYTECRPHSDSFAALLDRLATADGEFVPLVQYDGRRYFTHVSVPSAGRS